MIQLDIIVDLQYGDSGKGKVAHFLCNTEKYTHVLRYNGGGNAGHTIFHKGKKFVTHQVPVGVFYGVRSVIGSGCVVDPETLAKEIKMLEAAGVKVRGVLYVARNAHLVSKKHKMEEGGERKIGTTKQGIGPAYRDKYARVGKRAEQDPRLKPYLIELYEEFHTGKRDRIILGEGAQGFGLDIDWGDYPYVTSSHCTTAGALLNGFSPTDVREVWGVVKAYETYVGSKKFEPQGEVFKKMREYGEEFGATTGRPRQCNWMDLDLIEKGVKVNGVTRIVINKVDILRKVGAWSVIHKKKVRPFKSEGDMKHFLQDHFGALGISRKHVHFSERKDGI